MAGRTDEVLDFGAGDTEKGANDLETGGEFAAGRDAGQTVQTGAAQNATEDRFCLIVGVVSGSDDIGSEVFGDLLQESIAEVSGGFIGGFARSFGDFAEFDDARDTQFGAECGGEGSITVGVGAAQTVVVVCGSEQR